MLIGLIKFLFWFFFISYLLKLLIRILAPIFLKYFTNKMQSRFKEQFNQQYEDAQEPEGKVTLDKTNASTKTKSNDVGDYVDFEEIEDKRVKELKSDFLNKYIYSFVAIFILLIVVIFYFVSR